MKKAKFSGKLALKKRTISNLTSNSITGGKFSGSTGAAGQTCDGGASCVATCNNTCACPPATQGFTCGCTSGTSVVISC
ncbi:class I lanthipeptide [Spongiimicrobium sp. 3-5]|uniref:class I lanthipeptide n=1 Tax=Spongiimicrobium sp. 3-5 TaxID=3332596 RepID=UPI00397FF0B4